MALVPVEEVEEAAGCLLVVKLANIDEFVVFVVVLGGGGIYPGL